MKPLHDNVHAFADGELGLEDAQDFRAHLASCAPCQRELRELHQLKTLSARLREEERLASTAVRPAPRARVLRPAWHPRCTWRSVLGGALAVGLALALLGVPSGGRSMDGEPEEMAQGLSPTRSVEVRLTWAGAARHRPYGVMRSGGTSPSEQVPYHLLEELGRAGDLHGLSTGYLLRGEYERAALLLGGAAASPDVDNDRAALALLRGAPEEALRVLERVLQARPDHPQALWNRALALKALGREELAARDFRRVASLGEPGWSLEAGERAAALER
jgi:tetratricopeptide (TPR) repeat protein